MKCFVIMPFDEKTNNGVTINFDKIYDDLISKAVEDAGLTPLRCDQIPGAGTVIEDMFESILDADVAVADVSFANPNVFYELGVRHALKRSVTVIIKHEDTKIPFNINSQNSISYGDTPEKIATARKLITDYIEAGRKSRAVDSPVFSVLRHRVTGDADPIRKTKRRLFRLKSGGDRFVELVGGDLKNIRDYDIWVNSENTHMQMARHHDRSVSSVIRFLGAERGPFDRVVDDIVHDELQAKHDEAVGVGSEIPATFSLWTGPGKLADSHNVRRICHVAAVRGIRDKGYVPVENVSYCVWNTLESAHREPNDPPETSILFPFFGTGVGRRPLDEIAQELLGSALRFQSENEDAAIRKIGFITLTYTDFYTCDSIFSKHPDIELVEETEDASAP